MIELNQVVKRYHTKNKDVLAVDHVDLNIESGSIFGVIGFSGAGKSTLIRMFNNLEEPTSGDIIIDGDNINKLSKSDLRKKRQKVSMIFQHFNLLWSRTVISNIMFPLEIAGVSRAEAKQRALELVELVGLKGREKAYPSELSGGQKQRVGIARALANDPNVLLCDEATSALDPQTTDEILDLLLKIKEERNLTIVIITHEMQVIRRICDEVAVMENGRVIEQGNVDEVFEYLVDLNEKVGAHYPSMYQDLIVNNRKTEIDYINGAVATLGKQRHIEAPVNRFITDLIHTKESQRHAQD